MHSSSAFDQRTHRRRYFCFDAKVLMDDVGPYSVITLDVSLYGFGLFSRRSFEIGRNYAIAIEIPHSPRRINAWGTVVYCDPDAEGFNAGVRFLDMDAYSKACIEDLLTSHVGVC